MWAATCQKWGLTMISLFGLMFFIYVTLIPSQIHFDLPWTMVSGSASKKTRYSSFHLPISSSPPILRRSLSLNMFSSLSDLPIIHISKDGLPYEPPSFVPSDLWLRRSNMKLHPYHDQVPYMQAFDPISLERRVSSFWKIFLSANLHTLIATDTPTFFFNTWQMAHLPFMITRTAHQSSFSISAVVKATGSYTQQPCGRAPSLLV